MTDHYIPGKLTRAQARKAQGASAYAAPGGQRYSVRPGDGYEPDQSYQPTHAQPPGIRARPRPQGWYPIPRGAGTQAPPIQPEHTSGQAERSWQSSAACYLGLLGLLVWALGPIAVWLGAWALGRANRTGGRGRVHAIVGITAGLFASALLLLLVLVLREVALRHS